MTVGERNFTPEERAAGLLFRLRDSLKSRDRVERGGATLAGSGTTFGPDGMTLNGSGNLQYSFRGSDQLRAAMTIVVECTFGFAGNDGLSHALFTVITITGSARLVVWKTAANEIQLLAGGVTVATITYATWSPALVAGKNTFVISTTSGVTTVWLNGTNLGTSATAWTHNGTEALAVVGCTWGGGNRWIGTLSRFEIYGNTCTSVDEPYLRNGTLISKLDEPLIVLPGTSAWRDTTDSNKYKTEVRGKSGITSALLGSTGLVTTEFPSIVKPRGFSFDGGDAILVQNAQQLSFPDPAPFTVAMLVENLRQITSGAGANVGGCLAEVWSTVGSPVVVPWYIDFYESVGNVSLRFQTFDGSAVARGTAYTVSIANAGWLRKKFVLGCVFDGTTWRIYIDGVQVASTVAAGCFTGASPGLYFGSYGSNFAVRPYLGRETLPCVYDFAASPMQTKALTARLRYQARRG